MAVETVGTPGLWIGFTVLALLALALGVFHRKAHVVSLREAATWSMVWISLAALFNVGVYHWFGAERGLEFLISHLIEKALSVDNIFVFAVLFSYFAVPAALQASSTFLGHSRRAGYARSSLSLAQRCCRSFTGLCTSSEASWS